MPNKATNNEVIIYRMSEEKNMEGKSKTELVENFIEAARSGRLKITFKTFGDPDPDARLKAIKSQLERIREEVEKIRRKHSWDEATHKVLLDRAIASARAVGYPTHEHDEGGFYSAANSIPEINPKNRHILEHFARVVFFVVRQDVELIKQQEGELLRAYDDDPPTYTLTAQGELFPLTDADLPPILRRVMVLCARRTLERAWDVFPQLLGLIDRALKPQELSEDMGEVENVITTTPTKYVYPLAKAARLIDEISGKRLIALEQRGAKQEITASVTVTDILNSINSLTPFDISVHDAIGTLFYNGNCLITPQMINNTMSANDTYLPSGEPRYENIISSVKKLFRHRIEIDTTKEGKNGKKNYCGLIPRRYDSALVSGKFVEYGEKTFNGYKVKSYFEIFEPPILYAYSSDIKQITTYRPELVSLPEKNYTVDAIVVRDYVIKRLRIMQNAKKRGKRNVSNKISLEPIYKKVGIIDGNTVALRKRRAYVRSIIKNLLNNWVKEKEIKGHKEEKGARGAITAFVISL